MKMTFTAAHTTPSPHSFKSAPNLPRPKSLSLGAEIVENGRTRPETP